MIITTGKLLRKIMESDKDKSRLGRWTWIKYRGKNKLAIHFISAYQCGEGKGPTTVYME